MSKQKAPQTGCFKINKHIITNPRLLHISYIPASSMAEINNCEKNDKKSKNENRIGCRNFKKL